MAENGSKIELLAVRVASGQSISKAAGELKIGARTAYRLAGSPKFRQQVNEIRTAVVCEAVGQLATITTAAATRLSHLIQSDDESVALRACTVVLDRFSKLSDSVDIRQRLEAIESAQQVQQGLRVAQ